MEDRDNLATTDTEAVYLRYTTNIGSVIAAELDWLGPNQPSSTAMTGPIVV